MGENKCVTAWPTDCPTNQRTEIVEPRVASIGPFHCGWKLYEIDAFILKTKTLFQELRSEWVSKRANERAQQSARASEARSAELANVWANERADGRMAQCVDFIVILPTVHSLLRSLVRPHHSLIRLLPTACFARALRCTHSFVRSLTHSLRSTWERDLCLWSKCVIFKLMMRPTDGRMDRWMVGQPNGEKAMFYQWTNQPINQRTDQRSDI